MVKMATEGRGFHVGDRVESLIDDNWGNPSINRGMEGTVVGINMNMNSDLQVCVEWDDDISRGHRGEYYDGNTDKRLSDRPTCYWVHDTSIGIIDDVSSPFSIPDVTSILM